MHSNKFLKQLVHSMVSEEKYRIRITGGDTVKCDNLNKKMGSSRGCESHM